MHARNDGILHSSQINYFMCLIGEKKPFCFLCFKSLWQGNCHSPCRFEIFISPLHLRINKFYKSELHLDISVPWWAEGLIINALYFYKFSIRLGVNEMRSKWNELLLNLKLWLTGVSISYLECDWWTFLDLIITYNNTNPETVTVQNTVHNHTVRFFSK